MKLRVALVTILVLTIAGPSLTSGQPLLQSQIEPSGSIEGKVTLRGVPVRGAMIRVRSVPQMGRDLAGAKSDANGHYRITNLAPGRYTVLINAPALTPVEERAREVTLDLGETRENVDFSLVR